MKNAELMRQLLDVSSNLRDSETLGPFKENLSWEEAKEMLEKYPLGGACHKIFENGSFVFIAEDGSFRFWHSENEKVMSWDWVSDIQELLDETDADDYGRDTDPRIAWWYEPVDYLSDGQDMNEFIKWFKGLQDY